VDGLGGEEADESQDYADNTEAPGDPGQCGDAGDDPGGRQDDADVWALFPSVAEKARRSASTAMRSAIFLFPPPRFRRDRDLRRT